MTVKQILRAVIAPGVLVFGDMALKLIETGTAIPDWRTLILAGLGASLRAALKLLEDQTES